MSIALLMPTTPACRSALLRALIVVLAAVVRGGIAIGDEVLECEPRSISTSIDDDGRGDLDRRDCVRRAPNAATAPASTSVERSDD